MFCLEVSYLTFLRWAVSCSKLTLKWNLFLDGDKLLQAFGYILLPVELHDILKYLFPCCVLVFMTF